MLKTKVRQLLGYNGYESILWHRSLIPLPRLQPSFFVVGAQKGGTSALYRFLTSCPDVAPAYKKELFFFDQSFQRGLKYYRNFFPLARSGETQMVGDFSPSYFPNEVVPQRLAKAFPKAKIIFMVRPPLERLLSHYAMAKGNGWERLPLPEALEREGERLRKAKLEGEQEGFEAVNRIGYLEHSLYGKHLTRWLQEFSREQFLFVDNENLSSSPVNQIQKVRKFIGLEAMELNEADPLWKKRVFTGETRKEALESIPEFVSRQIEDDFALFEKLRREGANAET